jgi:MFS family permease
MAIGPASGGMRLRPLDIGDILDETFRIYRRRFVPLITTMAIVVVPSSLLSAVATLVTGFSSDEISRRLQQGGDPTLLIAGGLVVFLVAVVTGIVNLAAVGAAIMIASGGVFGQQVSVGEAYRRAFGRFWSLFLAGLVSGLTVSLLVITCLGIPFAIYIGLGWAMAFPVIVLEDRGPMGALGRSWELVRGNRWRQLIVWVLMILIFSLLVSVPTGIFSFIATILAALSGGSQAAMTMLQIGNILFNAVGQTLFGGILYITSTLLYYDLRIRKEAFDLEQRMPGAESPTMPYQEAPRTLPTYPPYPPPPPMGPRA